MAGAAAARVLIVTDAADDDALLDALTAGIADLVARRDGGRTAAGTPRVLELVRTARPGAPATLTPRQVDVLRQMARGLSNKEIARELAVSPATVKTHVAQAIAILGAANRTDAAIKARERGVI